MAVGFELMPVLLLGAVFAFYLGSWLCPDGGASVTSAQINHVASIGALFTTFNV